MAKTFKRLEGRTGAEFGAAKQRSGWLIPLAVFVLTAVLSALVLAYYFVPSAPELVEEQAAPTDSNAIVALNVAGQSFHIPSSYLPFASTRKGGNMTMASIETLLPDLSGYSLGEADDFASNASDSRVIHILISSERVTLPEQERLDRIYLPLVQSRTGTPSLFELTKYDFNPNSGYASEELLIGQTPSGLVLLRCTLPNAGLPSPSCLREMPLGNGLSFSYRFKRVHLERWREIDADLRALIGSFMDKS